MIRAGRKTAAAGIFLGAFILRAAYAFYLPPEYSDPDERVYSDLAANLLAGEGLVSNQDQKRDLFRPDSLSAEPARYRWAAFPPLYPVFLAGAYLAGARSLLGMRLLQAFLGALACLLLLEIARTAAGKDRRGESAARAAAGMMAFYPPLIHYSGLLFTETLFVLLLLAAVSALLKLRRNATAPALIAAAFWTGLGILCRPTLVPFFFLASAWLFSRRRARRHAVSYFFLALLSLAPWTARNYLRLGRLVPLTSQGGSNLYLANNPLNQGGTISHRELLAAGIFHRGEDEDEVEYNRGYGRKALAFIRRDPIRFGRLSLRRLLWFYHLDGRRLERWYLLIPFWLVLLAGLAGVRLWRRRGWEWFLPAAVILSFTAVHMVFLPEGRYRLPLMPFFFLFSAPVFLTAFRAGKPGAKADAAPAEEAREKP